MKIKLESQLEYKLVEIMMRNEQFLMSMSIFASYFLSNYFGAAFYATKISF